MNMEMYWSQQEVFLMATLSLFPDKIKGVPLTPGVQWRHYFNVESFEQLAQQLNKYKRAGYIDFDENTQKVMYLGVNDASNFHRVPISFVITRIDSDKVTSDLTKYLENWQNNKLLASTAAYKPDDYIHQHNKLLGALARAYQNQSRPRIDVVDVFGDETKHEPPFWETILAPQLIDNCYEILQMDYSPVNGSQPFADIEITDTELRNSLQYSRNQSNEQTHKTRIFINDERIIFVEIDGDENYRISRKQRTDSTPNKFINHMLSHPRTRISYADIEIAAGSHDITELVRGCGFDETLKTIFFAGTTEKVVLFDPSPVITEKQAEYIKKYGWDKVGKHQKS